MQNKSFGKKKIYILCGALAVILIYLLSSMYDNTSSRDSDAHSSALMDLAVAGESGQPNPSTAKEKKKANDVTVYVTSWCPACTMTINYLKQKKIPYTVKDVEKNEDYRKEMVSKVGGYRGVPVIDINGKVYLGFNPMILDDLAK